LNFITTEVTYFPAYDRPLFAILPKGGLFYKTVTYKLEESLTH